MFRVLAGRRPRPRIDRLACLALAVGLGPLPAADETAPTYTDHGDLSYYLDARGRAQPVTDADTWDIRRRHITRHMQTVMGPLPVRDRDAPPAVHTLEVVEIGSILRKKISYPTELTGEPTSAYLFLPLGHPRRRAAVLCLHQTSAIGKDEPAGLGGDPDMHYALELARRGYVTLAPDYPGFGDSAFDLGASASYRSTTMKAVHDNRVAVDLLQSLPQVDARRIGCLGHSLGGHNAMFTAAFDDRLRVVVSSAGFTRFGLYAGGDLAGWSGPTYMPLIASRYGNDPGRVPFDFDEVVGALAPRPFLALAPTGDDNFDDAGVRAALRAARPIYELLGAAEHLQALYPEGPHGFSPAAREAAYRFLDRHLRSGATTDR